MTKAEIKASYKSEHDRITKEFYIDKTLDLATFNAQHNAVWSNMLEALLAEGYATRRWHYTLSTTIGGVSVVINVDSPHQLSLQEKQTYLQALKTATWTLTSEVSDIVEV